jgi:tungstate transport system substrate-binding protein
MVTRLARGAIVALTVLAGANLPAAGGEIVTLATTTTVEDSGLLEHLLDGYAAAGGDPVRAVVRGTGEVLALARRGDADLTLTHHPEAERALVADGAGLARAELMFNDFVIVGPRVDSAEIEGMSDAPAALARIAEAGAPFVSRGDDSGTHRRERALWDAEGGARGGDGYLESGGGMGMTLNIASARNAYTLADRGTWLAFGNKGELRVLVEGDPWLKNVYGLVLVDPDRRKGINAAGARRLADWLLSSAGQAAIADYRIGGVQAFHPGAAVWE